MDDANGAAGLPGAAPWRPPGATAADVAEARRLYELTGTLVPAIRERFGWTESQFRRLRIGEGWTPRPQVARPTNLRGRRPVGADALAFRLNRLIAFGLDMLERRATEEGITEANGRALVALCRAQEIMMRSQRAKNGTIREKKTKDDGYDFRDDPLWLAAEFARRLSRLAGPRSAGAEGAVRALADQRAEDLSR